VVGSLKSLRNEGLSDEVGKKDGNSFARSSESSNPALVLVRLVRLKER